MKRLSTCSSTYRVETTPNPVSESTGYLLAKMKSAQMGRSSAEDQLYCEDARVVNNVNSSNIDTSLVLACFIYS